MNQQDQSKPYLVGGLIMGVLSVIPLVNAGNTCCCLWAWVGGAVAAKLLVDGSAQPVTINDGAKVGFGLTNEPTIQPPGIQLEQRHPENLGGHFRRQ